MKQVLFIDRDGILMHEPEDHQIDHVDKVRFLPGMFRYLGEIASKLNYTLVMVSNQDGLGKDSYPEAVFRPIQDLLIRSLEGEDIVFDEILIDRTFPEENSPNRKPGIGMLGKYVNGPYDLENSYVIGDRMTDMQLAKNLGTGAILLNALAAKDESAPVSFAAATWKDVFEYLYKKERKTAAVRCTSETKIEASMNLDGSGICDIHTGIGFFDHMLEQIGRHGLVDLFITLKGDLWVDEHHTVEDCAIVVGQLFKDALGRKAGIERYGFCLPMDDCKAEVLIDFGGRPWINWDVQFEREKIGEMPTEMFFHFFKSFSDHALCNLSIRAEGDNEHHKAEAVFKAFAKAILSAKTRHSNNTEIPSTKGML
jgi:imidazoleglycerol-phosphate dehydratase / histidinol-phosphatase